MRHSGKQKGHDSNLKGIGHRSRKNKLAIFGSLLLVALFVFIRLVPYLVPHSKAGDGIVVFGDAPNEADWGSHSYGTDIAVDTTTFKEGAASMKLTHTSGWTPFYVKPFEPIVRAEADRLSLWLNGGSAGGQLVMIKFVNADGQWVHAESVELQAGVWQEVDFDIRFATGLDEIYGLILQNGSAEAAEPYFVDEVILYKQDSSSGGEVSDGIEDPDDDSESYVLTVDTYTEGHDISEYIYGVNLATYEMGDQLNLPLNRYGGNSTSRYNWKTSSTMLGGDWFFMSNPRGADSPNLPHGSATDVFVEQNISTGTDSLLTIPMMGYVSKTREVLCGFSVEKYGEQTETERWHPDCGNGRLVEPIDGEDRILWADPLDTSIPVDEVFVQEWVEHLSGKYGTAEEGGVQFYSLDNEPMLWFHNHFDVHPDPVSYDEIRDKTYQYAPAIKEIDPTAQTIGPAVWGWHAYFSSALDQSAYGYADRDAHGGTPFLEWYLQQMAAYEAEHGVRILDYLDLHYYPSAEGVTLSEVGDQATQQRRLNSTRTLWDRTYKDRSWIADEIYLVPRMHNWVDDNYPGTKLSISEYNFGGLEDINGAIAQADVLGIFGRENLHMAMLWGWLNIEVDDPWAYAYRMYRNYDGQKSTFGDVSLSATSSDEWDVSVFAAERSTDGAITIMVVNKLFEPTTADIRLENLSGSDEAEVYQYSGANLNSIQKLASQSTETGRLSAELPAQSITLFVLKNVRSFEPIPTPTLFPSPIPQPEEEDGLPTATPAAPSNPSPRDPDFQQELNNDTDERVDLGWLEVEIPAETFSESFFFELKYSTGYSDPGELVDRNDGMSADRPVEFTVGTYKQSDNSPLLLPDGEGLNLTIDVSPEMAQKLASGELKLFVKQNDAFDWNEVPTQLRTFANTVVSFNAPPLSTVTIRPETETAFLPVVKR